MTHPKRVELSYRKQSFMSNHKGEWHYHTESTHICPILKESGIIIQRALIYDPSLRRVVLSYRKHSFMSNPKGEWHYHTESTHL